MKRKFVFYTELAYAVGLLTLALGAALIVIGVIAAVNWGGSFDIFIRIIGVIVLAIGVIDLMKAAGVKF